MRVLADLVATGKAVFLTPTICLGLLGCGGPSNRPVTTGERPTTTPPQNPKVPAPASSNPIGKPAAHGGKGTPPTVQKPPTKAQRPPPIPPNNADFRLACTQQVSPQAPPLVMSPHGCRGYRNGAEEWVYDGAALARDPNQGYVISVAPVQGFRGGPTPTHTGSVAFIHVGPRYGCYRTKKGVLGAYFATGRFVTTTEAHRLCGAYVR